MCCSWLALRVRCRRILQQHWSRAAWCSLLTSSSCSGSCRSGISSSIRPRLDPRSRCRLQMPAAAVPSQPPGLLFCSGICHSAQSKQAVVRCHAVMCSPAKSYTICILGRACVSGGAPVLSARWCRPSAHHFSQLGHKLCFKGTYYRKAASLACAISTGSRLHVPAAALLAC